MKKYILLSFIIAVLLLTGCNNPTTKGMITAKLNNDVLDNGGTTTIEVTGKNIGDLPFNAELKVIPEDSSKLIVQYPGSLTGVLQPGEPLTKIIAIQGFSDYSSTSYQITIQLINADDSSILDEIIQKITVQK